jgi:SAM-dependent methyltransferase
MSKKRDSLSQNFISRSSQFGSHPDEWQAIRTQVAERFNRQYRGEAFELPPEVEAMPIFRDWAAGTLSAKVASPFWEIAQPQKNQHCLDIGCGVSFLVYPWRDWGAFFYGQEISTVAQDALTARGPQLNSKLFKGVHLGAAHQLDYEDAKFDLAIATGWSCYFPRDYWTLVMSEVKRVLKPNGQFVFDVLDPEKPLATDWGVLETYLGAEVFLESIAEWEKTIAAAGAKTSRQSGELFDLYSVHF